MRTIHALLGVVLAAIIFCAVSVSTPSCGATPTIVSSAGSAATCELSVLEQQAKDVGQDITIGEAIFSAIASGGATIPALLSAIDTDLGPGTSKCASLLADAIETAFEAQGSGTEGAPLVRKQGHAALRAEMKKRGYL